jgi:hypothetical protein
VLTSDSSYASSNSWPSGDKSSSSSFSYTKATSFTFLAFFLGMGLGFGSLFYASSVGLVGIP